LTLSRCKTFFSLKLILINLIFSPPSNNNLNGLSAAARARALEVEISTNGKNYSIIYQAEQNHIISPGPYIYHSDQEATRDSPQDRYGSYNRQKARHEVEVVPVPRGVDISSRGIATQSSLSQWSRDKSSVVTLLNIRISRTLYLSFRSRSHQGFSSRSVWKL
jgi:hypothetical protein